jgi:hypothetical protein
VGPASLVLAAAGLIAVVAGGPGVLVGIGLAILAVGTGIVGWRRPGSPRRRLAGAAGIALGVVALLLGALQLGLTLVALDRLEHLLDAP